MKIQCDNCNKKEASVFCSADEAALCDGCDQRVHHANKLASKHQRFSLLQSSSSNFPLCDICQEKRALLFCQQDRAILCRDCDLPLHKANEHTQKHNRFLLTGIKLSQIISNNNTTKKDVVVISNNTTSNESDLVPNYNFKDNNNNNPTNNCLEKIPYLATSHDTSNTTTNNTISSTNNQLINGGSTSKISDYLIDMLPGWRFEDLLLDSSASLPPLGFYKSGNNNQDYGVKGEDEMSSFYDVEKSYNEKEELTISSPCYSSTEFENCWVPQSSIMTAGDISNVVFGQNYYSTYHQNGLFHGTKQQQQHETSVNNVNNNNTMKFNRKCLNDDDHDDDDFFPVPQITSSAVGSKRSRSFW